MSQLVMIIDDSLLVRKIVEISLKREGFACVSYSDGLEALRAIAENRHPVPHLIFLDIGLPKMDGYDLVRHLKTKPQFHEAVIVMLSARDGITDRLKGRLAGAQHYMTKPFKIQDILSIVHSYLDIPVTV